jgi:acetylornithine/N-succinyldiaminopimelate aminotransferase
MAVGMAVVKEVIDKDLPAHAQIQGNYLMAKLNEIAAEFNLKNVRGKGLLIAFDLPANKGSEVVAECFKAGLIINSPRPSIIRLMPPLIVNEEQINQMIQILSAVLEKVL